MANSKIEITKEKIIRTIATKNNEDVMVVKEFYNTLEQIIFNYLSTADKDNDISIKLFNGITLNGVFIPEHKKLNNNVSKNVVIPERIKPKFSITRYYCDKLNQCCNNME